MVSFIEYLKLPAAIGGVIAVVFMIMQIIGGILDFEGKAVPAVMNIRKHFAHKKQEKKEASETLRKVKVLLCEIGEHYSADNIAKRDNWMKWVDDRAKVYDDSIVAVNAKLSDVADALKDNTKMTEEMFVQNSRDRIIDFATKVGNPDVPVSREEFNRIFKVYNKYEKFLEERNLTNGEIDIAIHIIKEVYERHMKERTFLEDMRGIAKV